MDEFTAEPHDPDAERAVLGAMMTHPTAIKDCSTLTATDFYVDLHFQTWIVVKTLHSSGLPITPITVLDEMRRARLKIDPGVGPFLADCYAIAPAPGAVPHYVEIVRTLAQQRKLGATGTRFIQLATRPRMDAAEIAQAFQDARDFLHEATPAVVTDRDLDPILLTEFLATPDAPVTYRLDQLWPAGGRVMLSAQYKAGKSTLIANLMRSMADAHPFLGKFTPTSTDGRVTLIDDELDQNMLRRWLREQQIEDTDHINVRPLRGRLSTFNILDAPTRAAWASRLRDAGTEILIFDCLRPVLDSLGLSEDKDGGRFLVALDELLYEAEISEAVVVHHAGHQGERSRGDSRYRDWPDVEWRIVREAEDPDDATGQRPRTYFSALGRDVDEPEGLLSYEPSTRWLTLTGGTRKQTAADGAIPEILTFITANPGKSQREIENGLSGDQMGRDKIRAALRRGIDLGRIDTAIGNRGARLHFISSTRGND